MAAACLELDVEISRQIRQLVATEGRIALIDRVTQALHHLPGEVRRRVPVLPPGFGTAVTVAVVESSLDQLEAVGYAPSLRTMASALATARERLAAKEGAALVALRSGPYCDYWTAFAAYLEAQAAAICALSVFIPELVPVCAEASLMAVIAWVWAQFECNWL